MAARCKPFRKRKCPHCDYTPPTGLKWQRHERTHSAERPFACPSCDWMFMTKTHRDSHVKQVHLREGRVTCSWEACGKTFSNGANMRIHLQLKHLNQRFACHVEGCTFTCSSKSGFSGHIKAVHEEARITCPVAGCAFRSTRSSTIRRHRRVKHDKKVHSCSYEDCSFSTLWLESLRKHVKTMHASMQESTADPDLLLLLSHL